MGRSVRMAFFGLLLAAGVLSCDLLGSDDGDDESSDIRTILTNLGVDTDSVASRKDAKGNTVDPGLNPLGSSRTILSKESEIFFSGAYYDADSGQKTAVFSTAFDNTTYSKADSDTTWTTYPNKSVAADMDADGYDEVVAMYYNSDSKNIIIRELDHHDNTFKNKVSYSVAAEPANAGETIFKYRQSLVSADIDGDGKDEILLTNGTLFLIYDDDYDLLYETTIAPLKTESIAVLRVAAADFDGDGKSGIILVNGADNDEITAKVAIYDWDGSALTTALAWQSVQNVSVGLQSCAVAAGDIDGDNIPELVFAGAKTDSDSATIMVMDVSADANSNLLYQMIDAYKNNGEAGEWILSVACEDLDGDQVDEIVCWNSIYALSGSGAGGDPFTLDFYNGGENVFGTNTFADMLALGDVNDDEKADIVLIDEGKDYLNVYTVGSGALVRLAHVPVEKKSGDIGGSLCLPDVDRDSKILSYLNHELKFTEPRIIAVITSPPYWSGIAQADNYTSMTYGDIQASGSETTNSYGFSVSASFGVSAETPLFGSALSVEVKATIENSFTWTYADSTEITTTRGFTASGGEDKVVFSAIPFDCYYYTIVGSPKTSEIGTQTVVSIPRTPVILSQSRSYYNANNGDGEDIDETVLSFTMGDPLSYPDSGDRDAISTAKGGKGLYTNDNHCQTIAQGNGSTSLSITKLEEEAVSFDYDLAISVEKEVVVSGVLTGSGLGFNYGYGYTNSVSSGTFVEVAVGDIINAPDYAGHKFKYGLMAYPETKGDQQFTVVTCWVDPL